MSDSVKQLIANCANALKTTGPKTGQGIAASSNWATLPIRRRTKRNIFKNGATNPFCRRSPACPTHSPATNKKKVIMILRATNF